MNKFRKSLSSNVSLGPDLTALGLIESTYSVAMEQVDEIIGGRSVEALHRYRVQLRRARALATLTKGTLSKAKKQKLENYLKLLTKPTTDARDLDVLIAHRDDYLKLLKDKHRDGATKLFSMVEQERQRAWNELTIFMTSNSFAEIRSMIDHCLSTDLGYAGKQKDKKLKDLLPKNIYKQYKHVVELADSIIEFPHSTEIHQLRIECKKLRYSMDVIDSIFTTDEIKPLINQLKQLQDSLGEHHDLVVQRRIIKAITMRRLDEADIKAAKKLRRLLKVKQTEHQEYVVNHLMVLTGSETEKLFKQAFGRP